MNRVKTGLGLFFCLFFSTHVWAELDPELAEASAASEREAADTTRQLLYASDIKLAAALV